MEGMALRPAQSNANAEHADLGVLVGRAGIVGHVQAGDAQGPAGAGDRHDRVEHRGGPLELGVVSVAVGLETDAIDRAIHLRHAQDLLDLLGQRGVFAQIDRFAAEALGLLSRSGIMSPTITTAAPKRWHAAAQARPTGPAAGHVDRRAGPDAGRDRAVIAGGEDVGQAASNRGSWPSPCRGRGTSAG